MSLVSIVLILCTLSYVCLAVPDLTGDLRATVFLDAFSHTRGSPAADPLHIPFFSGSFPTLRYRNYNTTVTGLSRCVASDFILSADGRVINFVLDCPGYSLYSSNEVQGYLLYKNMSGRGTVQIDYGRYIVRVYAVLNYVNDLRNTYFQIGDFSLGIEVIGPIQYSFTTRQGNTQIQNEEINELANSNWYTVAIFSREPVWYPIMNRIVAGMNQYLRTKPIQLL